MALIKCPECGREIEDTLKYCPQCGYPISKGKIEKERIVATSYNDKLTNLEDILNNTINTFNDTNTKLTSSITSVNTNLNTCIAKSNAALSLAISKSMPEQIVIKTNLDAFFGTINKTENYYKLTPDSILYLQKIWNNNNILDRTNKEIILYISDPLLKSFAMLYLPSFTEGLNLNDFIDINNWYIISYNLIR